MSQFESKDKILTLSKTSKSGSSQVPQLTWYIRGSGNLTSLDPIPRNPAGSSFKTFISFPLPPPLPSLRCNAADLKDNEFF